MGRIEEALRRSAAQSPSAEPPVPESSGGDGGVFESPWSFSTEETAHRGRTVDVTVMSHEREPATLVDPRPGAFAGFDKRIVDHLVVSAAVPPLVTEQFRRLAATLHHAQVLRGLKTVIVASAHTGDGKTLTATNLALTLSESYKRKVLLIDADLRRPSLHNVFQVPNIGGLNEGLQARSDGKLAVHVVTETLTLLPAGRPQPDPMGGLTSNRMRSIIAEAAQRFDWVIIDTAPVALLADANILAGIADAALLVIRAGATPFAAVTKALEALGRERVLGVVLNGSETLAHEEAYARYYIADQKVPRP